MSSRSKDQVTNKQDWQSGLREKYDFVRRRETAFQSHNGLSLSISLRSENNDDQRPMNVGAGDETEPVAFCESRV